MPRRFHSGPIAVLLVLALLGSACGEGTAAGETDGRDASSLVERGEDLYTARACASCHSVNGSKSVGPTWKGLYGSQVLLDDGTTVRATDEYLARSILRPAEQTVDGYPKHLMESVIKPDSLTPDEVDALVAYIESLD